MARDPLSLTWTALITEQVEKYSLVLNKGGKVYGIFGVQKMLILRDFGQFLRFCSQKRDYELVICILLCQGLIKYVVYQKM